MDRLAIIQVKKSVKQRLHFPVEEKIKSMDRYGYNPRAKNR